MEALVNEAQKKHGRSLMLLKKARHRIEQRLLSKSKVIIAIENLFSYCRNCCDIDAIEVQKEGIFIDSGSFEAFFQVDDSTTCDFDEDNLIFNFVTNDEVLHMEFL